MKKWTIVGFLIVLAAFALLRPFMGSEKNAAIGEPLPESLVEEAEDGGAEAIAVDRVSELDPKEAPAIADDFLSGAVRMLAGLDGMQHSYLELCASIKGLPEKPSEAEIAALRAMLEMPSAAYTEMRSIASASVRNDVLEYLVQLPDFPEGLATQVLGMFGNPECEAIWKDYCVQFMGRMYDRLSDSDDPANPRQNSGTREEMDQIVDALQASTQLSGPEATAGTALIQLGMIAQQHEPIRQDQLIERAFAMASDESMDAGTRVTALRMAARSAPAATDTEPNPLAETARGLVAHAETDMLRCAALVTLGEIGTPQDRTLLKNYTRSGTRQLARAAKLALKKMDSRLL